MTVELHERVVFLNHLVSRSKARTSDRDQAPTLPGFDLLRVLQNRFADKTAIEFIGSDNDKDDSVRIKLGKGHDFIRIKDIKFTKTTSHRYVYILFEYGDQRIKTLPLVHTESFAGREMEGEIEEVGASCTHVAIRLPSETDYDVGRYRCAIEYVNGGVSRKLIETFFRRQLRRYADVEDLTFDIFKPNKKGKPTKFEYKFHPSLELMADVGRKLGAFAGSKKILTQILFTKRSERRSAGKPTDVVMSDYTADVEVKISALQGPEDQAEKRSWVSRIRAEYEAQGYLTHLSYRYAGGTTLKGKASAEVAGAADLLMCPKEIIYLDESPKRWREAFCPAILTRLRELVDRDNLWERAQ